MQVILHSFKHYTQKWDEENISHPNEICITKFMYTKDYVQDIKDREVNDSNNRGKRKKRTRGSF